MQQNSVFTKVGSTSPSSFSKAVQTPLQSNQSSYSKDNPFLGKIQKLFMFRKICVQENCFDDEDVKAIDLETAKVHKQAQAWEDDGIKRLRELIDKRKEILQTVEKTLHFEQEHPLLYQYLYNKTDELESKLPIKL